MEKLPTTLINTEKETRGFFVFMVFVLTALPVWMYFEQPDLRQPQKLYPFIGLMLLHIMLHWFIRGYVKRPILMTSYVIIQGIMTVGLVYFAHNIGMALGLAMALVGESIGIFGLSRRGIIASFYYLLMPFGFLWLTSGFLQVGWWLIATLPMLIFVILYVEMYTRQVKSNIRAQELLNDLEATNKQLTIYAAQVEDLTIASERQRMARELHDTLSQGLAGLILQLEAVDANLASGKTDRARQIIQQAMESARQTLSDARLAIDDLRQEQLTGCSEDLQKKISQFTNNTGIPTEFHCNLNECLTAAVADAVVGVVTESLMNISRHANAKRVSVNLDVENNTLALEIHDDGCGFNSSVVPASGHYGLIGMHERVSMVNGTMDVMSHPGAGTTIKVRIPYS